MPRTQHQLTLMLTFLFGADEQIFRISGWAGSPGAPPSICTAWNLAILHFIFYPKWRILASYDVRENENKTRLIILNYNTNPMITLQKNSNLLKTESFKNFCNQCDTSRVHQEGMPLHCEVCLYYQFPSLFLTYYTALTLWDIVFQYKRKKKT